MYSGEDCKFERKDKILPGVLDETWTTVTSDEPKFGRVLKPVLWGNLKFLVARGRCEEIKKTFTHLLWSQTVKSQSACSFRISFAARLSVTKDSSWTFQLNKDRNLLLFWISSVPAAICYQRSIKARIVARIRSKTFIVSSNQMRDLKFHEAWKNWN